MVPAVIVSFFRLRTTVPQPGPPAFRSVKELPKLLRGPQKVHVYSSILIQLVLGLGTVCWSEGWDDLRSITLCVVDAVLTSQLMVNVTTASMFLQFSATAILGLRHYLEVRIAKLEAAGQKTEKFGDDFGDTKVKVRAVPVKRTSTMKTFGFEGEAPPLPPNAAKNEARTTVRTASLQGREDSQIGWPSQVRRFGEADTLPVPERPGVSNPFRDTVESPIVPPANTTRIYNPKLGGYEDDRSPLFPPPSRPQAPNDKTISLSDYGDFRPSSEVAPPVPMLNGPPANGGDAINESSRVRKKESFSRPFDAKPSG